MKVSGTKVNVEKMEQGAWVGEKYGTPIPEMGDLCLKVRGSNNKAWRKITARLIDAVPRRQRVGGRLSPDEQDRITGICLMDAGLLDWENFEGDDGNPITYSKDDAKKYLTDPEYGKFRDAVVWACSMVADSDGAELEDDAGN